MSSSTVWAIVDPELWWSLALHLLCWRICSKYVFCSVFHKDSIGVLYAYSIHVSVMLSGTVNALNFHLNASYMPTASSFGSENAKHFSEMYNTSMTRAFPSTKRFSSTKTRFEVRKNKGNVAQPSWKNRAKKYLFCIFQLLFLLSITSSMRTKRGRKVVLDARENSLAHAEWSLEYIRICDGRK